jgi:predicted nucleic acid-binding Zn ribbon protein
MAKRGRKPLMSDGGPEPLKDIKCIVCKKPVQKDEDKRRHYYYLHTYWKEVQPGVNWLVSVRLCNSCGDKIKNGELTNADIP